ncbi:malic enzyme-like NAD(P)-binding protein [Streptomyces sp. NPDC101234]|uniref:malic enzyme-like NAD(P)-binding protein n=1 Tax=Streptomyces sp. NPDC101234 TaxID=3366138 RepID=UPI0037FA2544
MPADVIAWSGGKALVATGIPVAPVEHDGVTHQIGQANNALLHPGLGLGTIVSGASQVTPGMLIAAAQAVADQVDLSEPGASLLPPVDNLRESSRDHRDRGDQGGARRRRGHLQTDRHRGGCAEDFDRIVDPTAMVGRTWASRP